MKNIGGYFELELSHNREYHEKALCLNTGRNALEYILHTGKFERVYLPYYMCDALYTPLKRMNIPFEFYHIDESFNPLLSPDNIGKGEVLLYINYFGLHDHHTRLIARKYRNVIIDNSQSFFSRPGKAVGTFYSARKFFGVPDGAYLYTDLKIHSKIPADKSHSRFAHLLLRIDVSAEKGFSFFRKNEELISRLELKTMSPLTRVLLQNINYQAIRKKRSENFLFLHKHLKGDNDLKIHHGSEKTGPLAYPFLTNDPGIKKRLLKNKIYFTIYWENSEPWQKRGSFELELCRNMIALPIDQRYSETDLSRIIEIIK